MSEFQTTRAEAEHPTARRLRGMGQAALNIAAILLPIVGLLALGVAGFVLYTSIHHLGSGALAVNPGAAHLVAGSMVATLAVLVVAGVALSVLAKRRTLVLALMFTGAWLALAIVMALIDTWLSVATIRPDPTMLEVGVFIYSALPALPLLPLVILAGSAAHERPGQYPTLAAAFGALGFTMLKLALAIAMFCFEAFYGLLIGVNPVAAVFAALLNATAFSMALGNTEASAKEGDRGGVQLWGMVSVLYAFLMFAIAAETIIEFSNATGRLDALHAPPWLESIAQWAFVSSIGLSALLIALTFWRKSARAVATAPMSGDVIEGELVVTKPTRPALASRAAAQVRTQREAWGDLRQALNGDRATVKPAQIGASVAKDVPAQVAQSEPELAADTSPDEAAQSAAARPKSGRT